MSKKNIMTVITILVAILLIGFQLGRTYQANQIQNEMIEASGSMEIYSGNVVIHAGGHKVHVTDMRRWHP